MFIKYINYIILGQMLRFFIKGVVGNKIGHKNRKAKKNQNTFWDEM